jgi:hypothetical protein
VTGPLLSPEELAARTEADRRAYLDDGLVELTCGECGGEVEVKKNSVAHTTIQWTTDTARRCPIFTARDGCPHLRRGIEAAVAAGVLEIPEDRLVPHSLEITSQGRVRRRG